jgi:hypothetical protein
MTNLLVALLTVSAGDQVYGPCYYSVTTDGFLDQVTGDFARTMSEDPVTQTRHINWREHTDKLRDYYRRAHKHLIFGSHHVDQLHYLKSEFGDQVKTIAVNYTEHDYDRLLENLARNHVRLMRQNQLEPTSQDAELMKVLDSGDLIRHYMQEFDDMDLIPRSVQDQLDYTVEVKDFYNPGRMASHVCSLGFEFSAMAESYYDYWVSRQAVPSTKETLR